MTGRTALAAIVACWATAAAVAYGTGNVVATLAISAVASFASSAAFSAWYYER